MSSMNFWPIELIGLVTSDLQPLEYHSRLGHLTHRTSIRHLARPDHRLLALISRTCRTVLVKSPQYHHRVHSLHVHTMEIPIGYKPTRLHRIIYMFMMRYEYLEMPMLSVHIYSGRIRRTIQVSPFHTVIQLYPRIRWTGRRIGLTSRIRNGTDTLWTYGVVIRNVHYNIYYMCDFRDISTTRF